jgi:hypothetical protein
MASRQIGVIAEEGPPLMRRPSADAVAGNGAPLNTRCAPPPPLQTRGKRGIQKANVSTGR